MQTFNWTAIKEDGTPASGQIKSVTLTEAAKAAYDVIDDFSADWHVRIIAGFVSDGQTVIELFNGARKI